MLYASSNNNLLTDLIGKSVRWAFILICWGNLASGKSFLIKNLWLHFYCELIFDDTINTL